MDYIFYILLFADATDFGSNIWIGIVVGIFTGAGVFVSKIVEAINLRNQIKELKVANLKYEQLILEQKANYEAARLKAKDEHDSIIKDLESKIKVVTDKFHKTDFNLELLLGKIALVGEVDTKYAALGTLLTKRNHDEKSK